jgi:putative adhesin
MRTFDTPQPITAHIESAAGHVRLSASDRSDTVVEVRPCNDSRAADVRAAERTRVDFVRDTLNVSVGRWGPFGARTGAVDITVELPSRSRLDISVASAHVQASGDYADCRLASASGDLSVALVDGNLRADSASGRIAVEAANGRGSISTASGDATIGALDGDLKFQAASGRLGVDRFRGSLTARTASGGVAVATAIHGEISAQTASGDVEVGVAAGTAARLDIITGSGVVTNEMQPSDGPADGDDTLVINVRTASGDVAVRRSAASRAQQTPIRL